MGRRKKKPACLISEMSVFCQAVRKSKDGKYHPVIPNSDRVTPMTHENDFGIFTHLKDGRTVIAISGSDDLDDWIDNIDALFIELKKGVSVHKGFYESAMKFLDQILSFLTGDEKELYITGHSKGGAIAKLLAYLLARKGVKINCVVYGAPRIGNRGLKEAINFLPIYLTQVRNWQDPVWKLPLLLMGYKTVGHIKYLKPRAWYFIPGLGIKVHLNYHKNIRRLYESE
jgi:predicted lipase